MAKRKDHRWGKDGLFAVLVGLGVGVSLIVQPLIPQLRAVFFSVFALIVTVPLSTLRIQNHHIVWMGVRHSAVTIVAVLATSLPLIISVFLLQGAAGIVFDFPNIVEVPLIFAFIIVTSFLSSCCALLLQRYFNLGFKTPQVKWSFSNPRSWGVSVIICLSLTLIAVDTLIWIIIKTELLPYLGPTRNFAFNSQVIMAFLGIMGFVSFLVYLTNDAKQNRVSRR